SQRLQASCIDLGELFEDALDTSAQVIDGGVVDQVGVCQCDRLCLLELVDLREVPGIQLGPQERPNRSPGEPRLAKPSRRMDGERDDAGLASQQAPLGQAVEPVDTDA